ncbi:MAG TPA: hypothetical protein VLB80_05250 [Candidatus Babeliales bacterium]|nr:hypothetical protein [Candidatus Babeliales bacterium]
MKSIIEQASSIIKAIEKAWDQAGSPKEFSIKIFEKEERNFFGMTTKPAKIGIFFTDKPVIHEKSSLPKARQEIKECRPEIREIKQKTTPAEQASKSQPHHENNNNKQLEQQARSVVTAKQTQLHTITPSAANKIAEKPKTAATPHQEKSPRVPSTWNDTMVNAAQNWLKHVLVLMKMESVTFNSEIAGKNLKFTFNVPLITDPTHEKQLFRSLAHLITSSLRNQYKQEIKDLKVVLIRPE